MTEQRFVDCGEQRFFLNDIEEWGIDNTTLYYEKIYEAKSYGRCVGQIELTVEQYYEILAKLEFAPYSGPLFKSIRTKSGEIRSGNSEDEVEELEKSDLWMEDVDYLYIETRHGKYYEFFDGEYDFDIYDKYDEIEEQLRLQERDEKEKRIRESGEQGEREVDYVLSWLPKKEYLLIEKKSVGKYDKACIILNNPEFIDEAQEYDHIVIGKYGIFCIETKNYNGTIIIDQYGNWMRERNDQISGIRNPIQQVRRHEKLLKSIVGDINIISIICLAHPEIIIKGVEHAQVPVVKSDLLCDFIENYTANTSLNYEDIQKIANTIYGKMITQEIE